MGTRHSISDFDIQALIDNELSWEDQKIVQSFIENDHEAQKKFDEFLLQKKKIKAWYDGLYGTGTA